MNPSWYQQLVGGAPAEPSSPREILVVDDQPEVRAIVREMLERAGWVVRAADTSASALEILAERGESIGLALVDIILRESDGLSLARELRRMRPKLAIVMLSGRLNEESRWIVHENGHHFLPKPFSFAELRDTVATILGDPGSPAKG